MNFSLSLRSETFYAIYEVYISMRFNFKFNKQKILLIGLIGYYTIICLFSYLGHNHAPDFNFHDSCPACQWEVQAKEDDGYTQALMASFFHPLVLYEERAVRLFQIFISNVDLTINTSRAPPHSTQS